MSKNKKILLMLAKGGFSQADVAAALHASKRDVSACAKVLRERSLTFEALGAMGAAEIDDAYFPKDGRRPSEAYLQPDLAAMFGSKKRSPKLPVKLMWIEYCEEAAAEGRMSYSYQTFREMFSEEAERLGATRHFRHDPGAKAYIDWALPVGNDKAQSNSPRSPGMWFLRPLTPTSLLCFA